MTDVAQNIVNFCARECELQQSGERSVARMFQAWYHAAKVGLPLSVEFIEDLGRIIEPIKNKDGLRTCGVRVGSSIKPDWHHVPAMLESLCDGQEVLNPETWFYEFEEIHPFRDGNGRTGQILYNLLTDVRMNEPQWAPNYWDDPRRGADGGH